MGLQMSLRHQSLGPVPEEIQRWAEHNTGNEIVAFANQFSDTFDWDDFSEMYSALGQPAIHPVILATISILQMMENLSDRQAIEAVNTRLDWKYILRQGLGRVSFDHTSLVRFRNRLCQAGLEDLILNKLLHASEERGLLKHWKQRTDGTHVCANIRNLNRVERIHEALRFALNAIIKECPEWFMRINEHNWCEKYDRPAYNFKAPKNEKKRDNLVLEMGRDGFKLLQLIDSSGLPELSAVEILRKIWEQQFIEEGSGVVLRTNDQSPAPAERIISPHDTDARCGRKDTKTWMGYKVHITETCEDTAPRLITNVEATAATVDDTEMLAQIHDSLRSKGLKPERHLVDAGYTDSDTMYRSERQLGITVVGPSRQGNSWQAAEGKGFDLPNFKIDFQKREAVCPNGVISRHWYDRTDEKSVLVKFDKESCLKCPFRSDCTKSAKGPRTLVIKIGELFQYLAECRLRETTTEFKKEYAQRSGIEGTHSQAVRRSGLRFARYSGLAKTRLQALLTCAGLNVLRLANWLLQKPLSRTRQTRMKKLSMAAA